MFLTHRDCSPRRRHLRTLPSLLRLAPVYQRQGPPLRRRRRRPADRPPNDRERRPRKRLRLTRSHRFILTGCSTCTCCRVKGFASRGCRGRHTAMFYVYVLHSTKDNGFYIGYSTDLKRRLSEHTRGASFATKSRGPWKLIYYEAYTERKDAEGREKFLKSGAGRRFVRAQLRHYLRVKGSASRGSNRDGPTAH